MKLKFINLLLASALLVGSAQVFTSCKDNEADMFGKLQKENLTLYETIVNDVKPSITVLSTKVDNYYNELKAKDAELETAINNLKNSAASQSEVSQIATELANVKSEMVTAQQVQAMIDAIQFPEIPADLTNEVLALQTAVSTLESTVSTLGTTVTNLGNTVNGLSTDVTELKNWKAQWENVLPDVVTKATEAKAKADKNEADIAALQATVAALKSCECDPTVITNLESRVSALETKVVELHNEAVANLAEAKAYTDQLQTALKPLIEANTTSISEIKTTVQTLTNDVNAVKTDVAALTTKVNKNASDIQNIQSELGKLLNRVEYLENRVTSVIMQEVDNHIYGSLLTPFGISSNVLLAYAGSTPAEREFPSMDYEYDNTDPLTVGDLKILQQCGLTLATIPAGTVINRADNNLGTVYFTVNPGNINLDGKTFSLVNSLGETQGIELRNVTPSFHKVEHGYDASRSLTNGFYEADAYIAPGKVGNINFTIDAGLKAAVKEVLKAGRNNNRNTVATLAKALYQQVDGILPAYAISANWTEDGKALTTTGQYNMAVATVKPLSFTTLVDGLPPSLNKRIPDLGTLIDKVVDRFQFDFSGDKYKISIDKTFQVSSIDIQIRNVNIVIADMNVDVSVSAPVEANAYLNFDVETETGEVIHIEQVVPVHGEASTTAHTTIDMSQLQADLNAQLNSVLQNTGQDIQDAVDQLVNNISSEVVDLLTSLESQVNTTIDEVVADMDNLINSKIDGLVDRIENTRVYDLANRAIGRLNKILADPNHYLQAALFYKSDKGFGLMSSVKTRPTIIRGNGNGMLLVPTTLSAEIVCPAYEKFVAVTNVWKGNASAQGGDADCLKVLKASNAQKYLCSVLPGTQMTAPLAYTKGYTYEITYQAVDYTGVTSTQKYYVIFK